MCNVLLIKSCSHSKREPSACWPIKLRMFRFSIVTLCLFFFLFFRYILQHLLFVVGAQLSVADRGASCIQHPGCMLRVYWTPSLYALISSNSSWSCGPIQSHSVTTISCVVAINVCFRFYSFRFVVVLSPHFCSHFANGQLYTQIFCPRWQSFFLFFKCCRAWARARLYHIYFPLFSWQCKIVCAFLQ